MDMAMCMIERRNYGHMWWLIVILWRWDSNYPTRELWWKQSKWSNMSITRIYNRNLSMYELWVRYVMMYRCISTNGNETRRMNSMIDWVVFGDCHVVTDRDRRYNLILWWVNSTIQHRWLYICGRYITMNYMSDMNIDDNKWLIGDKWRKYGPDKSCGMMNVGNKSMGISSTRMRWWSAK